MARLHPVVTLAFVSVGVAAGIACGGTSAPPVTPATAESAAAPTAPSAPVASAVATGAPPEASAAPSASADTSGRGGAVGLGSIGGFGSGGGGAAPGEPAKLTLGTPTVSGKLPPDVVGRIVRQDMGRFRLCYEDLLKTKSTAHGSVTVEMTIAATGAVTATKDSGSDIGDPKMVTCVRQAMAGMKFPKPESGAVKATVSVTFEPPK
ncbi:MAG: AgmX/PglI C-terminal domain-containing protein [Polyangiaceae bacterium]|nr:AgmX/PglI C-terminal domain-containing protein [Polyangiaceae bacterium]